MRRQWQKKQRGVAVVTALLLTTLAITIVASLFWQQQVQVRSIENQRLQLQKQWILRGALDWARLILREDALFSQSDTLDEPWAVPLSETRLDQYVENGRVDNASDAVLSGQIVDAQSRYNLANLSTNGKVNPAEVAVFARLLSLVQLNPALAQQTAELMAASQRKQEGASNQGRPMRLTYLHDLLAVPGFTVDAVEKLRDLAVILPQRTKVNVNTAPAEVLAASIENMSLADAKGIVNSRNSATFRNLGDFTQRFPGGDGERLDVKTRYFLVNGRVQMNRAGLEVQVLVERQSRGKTELVWLQQN
jgi:general secretion pathway protein K